MNSRDADVRACEWGWKPKGGGGSEFSGRRPTIGFHEVADPAALSPGREFPGWLYHATQRPQMVMSREEEARLGREWSRVYIHQEYPKVKYHWNGKDKTVQSAVEEAALGGGWANNPGAFNPYKGPRPPRADNQDPAKWVREWSVPGLTDETAGRRSRPSCSGRTLSSTDRPIEMPVRGRLCARRSTGL